MEGGVVLSEENQNARGDKMKGLEMAKESKVVGNIMPRKKLSDISNFPHKNQDIRPPSVSLNTKEYIHKLHQENLTLVKLLADRNKIIQLHALEVHKLRTQCQQVQEKNMELARSNSQMLAELNSNKDRLKVLQHELGCKNGLLKAMQLEIEDKENTVRCQIHGNEAETIGDGEVGKFSPANNRDSVHCNKGRKRQSQSLDPTSVKPAQTKEKILKSRRSARFKAEEQDPSDHMFEKTDALDPPVDKPAEAENKVNEKRLCSRRQSTRFKAAEQETANDSFQISDGLDPTVAKTAEAKKNADNKRRCSRRQSARFESQEQVQEPTEDSFQVDDAKFPVASTYGCGPSSSVSAVKSEPEAAHIASGSEAQELRRSSLRPKRQVVEKVQSYKEIPINIKMRRTE